MHEKAAALQQRTAGFATAVVVFCETIVRTYAAQHMAEQLIDAATAVDSNYRAACRARSGDEFIAKLGIVIEEADESKGWLELLASSGCVTTDSVRTLLQEADELVAIFVASRKTAQRRKEERDRVKRRMASRPRR